MTDEDESESTDPGITVVERALLKFFGRREANHAAQEDRGTSTVNQVAERPVPANPVKQTKTVEELAAMIHQDLSQIEGCPERGVKVTVYGLNPWNSLLTFGVDAGPVPNKTDLQSFCEIITERLKRLYDVGGRTSRAEGEGEIALHGRNPRQPVDTTGGCPPPKDGRGERPTRNHRHKTESDCSRG